MYYVIEDINFDGGNCLEFKTKKEALKYQKLNQNYVIAIIKGQKIWS